MKKLLICPFFGPRVEWLHSYLDNVAERLEPQGYTFLFDADLTSFKYRVKDRLGITCPITPGGTKIHDYRPVLGELYADEIEGYDYWGHTDFDCVYGRIQHFFPDLWIDAYDIVTDNVYNYLCGPWTLYRSDREIASAFRSVDQWQAMLTFPETFGWVETTFSEHMKHWFRVSIERHHRHTEPHRLHEDGEQLMWGDEEISFFHFRYTKEWPL